MSTPAWFPTVGSADPWDDAGSDPWGDGSTPIPVEPEPFHATDTPEAMRARVHTVFTPHPSGNPHDWQEDSCFCYVGSDHDAGQEQLEPPHPDDTRDE